MGKLVFKHGSKQGIEMPKQKPVLELNHISTDSTPTVGHFAVHEVREPEIRYIDRIVEKHVEVRVEVPKEVVRYVDVDKPVYIDRIVPKDVYREIHVTGPIEQRIEYKTPNWAYALAILTTIEFMVIMIQFWR